MYISSKNKIWKKKFMMPLRIYPWPCYIASDPSSCLILSRQFLFNLKLTLPFLLPP